MRWVLGVLGAWLAIGAGPVWADSLTVFNEQGAPAGQGRSFVFDTAAGAKLTTDTTRGLLVSAQNVDAGEAASLQLSGPGATAPPAPGVYPYAQPFSYRQGDHAGIAVGYSPNPYSPCDKHQGSFEVRELERDTAGKVTRAWILFEEHCAGAAGYSRFGELRIGAAGSTGPRTVPTQIRWPQDEAHGRGLSVPVRVWSSSVTDVRVVGDDAADFVIDRNGCSGSTASSCDVMVHAAPAAAGVRRAWLRVTGAGGSTTDVPLEAYARGGESSLIMDSDPGEFVGDGQKWFYGPDANFQLGGTPERLTADVSAWDVDREWHLEFQPGNGDILRPGVTTTILTNNPSPGPRMDIYGHGRGCAAMNGTFTVHEIEFDHGDVSRASVSFDFNCLWDEPRMRGTLSLHAGDTTPPAPWMVASGEPTEPAPPPPIPATMAAFSEGGLGRGLQQTFDRAAGDSITAQLTDSGGLDVVASGGPYGRTVHLRLYTSHGVQPGIYRSTGRINLAQPPVLEVTSPGETDCGGDMYGNVEAREIEKAPTNGDARVDPVRRALRFRRRRDRRRAADRRAVGRGAASRTEADALARLRGRRAEPGRADLGLG